MVTHISYVECIYQGLHNVSPPKWLKNSVEITEGWNQIAISAKNNFKGVNQNEKLKQYVKTFIFPLHHMK